MNRPIETDMAWVPVLDREESDRMPKLIEQRYMIGREADGSYRVITRDIRYNDDGIPTVTTVVDSSAFPTVEAARDHARSRNRPALNFKE
jgi:hypothetical protein